MKQYRRLLGFVAAMLAVALAPSHAASSPPHGNSLGDSGRQILVMLKIGPAHYRLNSDYGGDYGDAAQRAALRRIARRIAFDHALVLVDDWPMPLLKVDCFVMAVPAGQLPGAVAARVSREPEVAWSEPMQVYRAQASGQLYNDPLFLTQPAAGQWHLADLHGIATGRGVTVAVIDSKIDRAHPDLLGQISTSMDFLPDHPSAPEVHGTGVAGIIAARAGNGLGIVGIAPQARVMGLRACWQLPASVGGAWPTVCDSLSLAKALQFAIEHRVDVINLSLSGPRGLLLSKLLDIGLMRGIAVVSAFDGSQPDGGFPASHTGVIAVSDTPLAEPRRGVYIAPGRDVPTTQLGGRWYLVTGSSYAAAHVSGLIALLRERQPSSTGPVMLVSSNASGAIDACATMVRAVKSCACACAPARARPAGAGR